MISFCSHPFWMGHLPLPFLNAIFGVVSMCATDREDWSDMRVQSSFTLSHNCTFVFRIGRGAFAFCETGLALVDLTGSSGSPKSSVLTLPLWLCSCLNNISPWIKYVFVVTSQHLIKANKLKHILLSIKELAVSMHHSS